MNWAPESARLGMTLRLLDESGNTANPSRVFSGLFRLDQEEQARCFVERTAILRLDGSPL
jgi:hypothetical protein